MCVLEGFRFLKMCLYIKDRFFLESCAPTPKPGKSALGTRLLTTLPRLRKQVLWRHGPRNVTWCFGWIFQDYFSEICLIISLWNPLLGSFCVILKRIFAFSVGVERVVCPPYHLLSVELMLEVQQSESLVIDLVIPRWSTLTVRSPGLPRWHCNALRRLVRRKNRSSFRNSTNF